MPAAAAQRQPPTRAPQPPKNRHQKHRPSSQELMDPTRVLPCEKWLYPTRAKSRNKRDAFLHDQAIKRSSYRDL
jgi:hypothetical protein